LVSARWQGSPVAGPTGAQLVAVTLNSLAAALRKIPDHAETALQELEGDSKKRALSWRCKQCGYRKKFTPPTKKLPRRAVFVVVATSLDPASNTTDSKSACPTTDGQMTRSLLGAAEDRR